MKQQTRDRISAALKRRAVARQCRMCGRKNAMVSIHTGGVDGRVCRYCRHEVAA